MHHLVSLLRVLHRSSQINKAPNTQPAAGSPVAALQVHITHLSASPMGHLAPPAWNQHSSGRQQDTIAGVGVVLCCTLHHYRTHARAALFRTSKHWVRNRDASCTVSCTRGYARAMLALYKLVRSHIPLDSTTVSRRPYLTHRMRKGHRARHHAVLLMVGYAAVSNSRTAALQGPCRVHPL